MENYDLTYIEPSTPEIKQIRELIKKQGDKVCKESISVESISKNASTFTFGWISVLQKAQLGRRSVKSLNDRFTLLSFVLCHYTPDTPDQVTIEIICSTNKSGKLLMELAEQKSISMGIKRIYLNCLDNNNLKRWYESLGYKHFTTIYSRQGVPKVYSMVKYL